MCLCGLRFKGDSRKNLTAVYFVVLHEESDNRVRWIAALIDGFLLTKN